MSGVKDRPGAISIESNSELTAQSAEVARIWVTNNAGSSACSAM